MFRRILSAAAVLAAMIACRAMAQPPRAPEAGFDRPPEFGPPGEFGRGGPRGFGGPGGQERKLVGQFDKDGDKRLNNSERQAAREFLKSDEGRRGQRGFGPPGGGPEGGPGGPGFGGQPRVRGGPGGPEDFPPRGPEGGPPGMRGGPGGRMWGRAKREPAKPGLRVSPSQVASITDAPLYEPSVLRTLFLDFENADWEAELADFHNTDVEVPATLIVDGRRYDGVGVRFRGASSYGMVPAGYKHSLNLSIDFVDSTQRLYGYKTLNLLNAHEDASFMSTVLYSHIARQYIPAPKANFAKVVINGESWGIYANVQQFNKEFLSENYPSTKGARWKVRGSPRGGGGLEYTGDDIDDYKRRFEIKSSDDEKSWKALVTLCKTLAQTPADRLEEALAPMLDIDGLLKFLALDVALINCDGYWVRASDYSLYLDEQGKFHVIPHDMNEAFRMPRGPGMGGPGGPGGPGGRGAFAGGPRARPGGRGGPEGPGVGGAGGADGRPDARGRDGFGPPGGAAGGIELDPLVGMADASKPLRSKVLAVPQLRKRYLQYVRQIAEESLDWKKLGPVVAQYRQLIAKDVEADTRKLESYEDFLKTTANEASSEARDRDIPLRAFAEQRRKFLLNYRENASAAAE